MCSLHRAGGQEGAAPRSVTQDELPEISLMNVAQTGNQRLGMLHLVAFLCPSPMATETTCPFETVLLEMLPADPSALPSPTWEKCAGPGCAGVTSDPGQGQALLGGGKERGISAQQGKTNTKRSRKQEGETPSAVLLLCHLPGPGAHQLVGFLSPPCPSSPGTAPFC